MPAASSDALRQADSLVAERTHLMLEVRTSVVNGTFDKDVAAAERWAVVRFAKQQKLPQASGRSRTALLHFEREEEWPETAQRLGVPGPGPVALYEQGGMK